MQVVLTKGICYLLDPPSSQPLNFLKKFLPPSYPVHHLYVSWA